MDDKAKGTAGINSQAGAQQSGFVILMGLLILVLGAAAWYGLVGGKKSESMKAEVQSEYIANLQYVKERMLTYAVLHPEIFDKGDVYNPGIGYFPCPDTSGDGISNTGTSCSQPNNLYTLGWVPQKLSKKNFSLLSSKQNIENKRYWFAVDTRFLVDATKYHYDNFTRFAPLNIKTPSLVDTTGNSNCDGTPGNPITSTCIPPLTLDGQQDIVMVLFYAGDTSTDEISFRNLADATSYTGAAAGQIQYYLEQPNMKIPASLNTSETGEFISKSNGVDPFNDYVIAITREEWNAAMLSRVAKDVTSGVLATSGANGIPDLCEIPLDVATNDKNSWFDDCRYSGTVPPYPCTDITTLVAFNETESEVVLSSRLWSFGFSGISTGWNSWFGFEPFWNGNINRNRKGNGNGNGNGAPILAVENIEGQGWRTALGCSL